MLLNVLVGINMLAAYLRKRFPHTILCVKSLPESFYCKYIWAEILVYGI